MMSGINSREVEITVSNEVIDKAQTFVRRRIPQGDEDWDCILSSQDKVEQLGHRLTLHDIVQSTDIEVIFQGYTNLIKIASESEIGFLKILVLATGLVLLMDSDTERCMAEDEERTAKVFHGIRCCFRESGSGGTFAERVIREYMSAVAVGAQLLSGLEVVLGQRAYELPWHG